MTVSKYRSILLVTFLGAVLLTATTESFAAKDLVRPQKILSKRLVIYDREVYVELARLWREYYDEFPSEDAYANWMYAARYAELPDYEKLLAKGLRKYPGSPVLHYLTGLQKHGALDNSVGRDHLERAAALDPTFLDPWFALVVNYMIQGDQERLNLALRNLLEGGAIPDVVMDYSLNMLAGLDDRAILVCNGDNDTYPGYILTQLLDHRPDVTIVNRSLLNAEWYPQYLMERGLMPFITQSELTEMRQEILADLKAGKLEQHPIGPFCDPLTERLIAAAVQAGRPVYFSWTLTETDLIARYREQGRHLGLVSLVTPPKQEHAADLQRTLDIWLTEYRTGGLDGWRLRYAKPSDATLGLAWNYAGALYRMMADITEYAPTYRPRLFRWYREHVEDTLPGNMKAGVEKMWCEMEDVPEIVSWCGERGTVE